MQRSAASMMLSVMPRAFSSLAITSAVTFSIDRPMRLNLAQSAFESLNQGGRSGSMKVLLSFMVMTVGL